MTLREELLTPIPGTNPAGVELRSDPVYDKIKLARREDDEMPQGGWETERKTADWSQVIKLTKDAIATKSKDLQLARSEERRVGKECRSRWAPHHGKKKYRRKGERNSRDYMMR